MLASLRVIASRIRGIFSVRREDREFTDELDAHLEMLTEENIRRGMSLAEARRQAHIRLGGAAQLREMNRDLRSLPFLETLLQDLRYGLRMLRKSPGFTAVAVLTLALGIGANSAVFSAIDAILLRPLPFPDADQLMQISQYHLKEKNSNPFVAPVRLEDWNRMNSTFQAMTGYYAEDDSEISGPLPEKVTIAFVAPRFLQVWGIAPALGRDFATVEERFGGPGAVLISHRFWENRFGGDPNALGKKLRIGRFSLAIVGVMPASFLFPNRDVDLWSPDGVGGPYAQNRDLTWYTIVGRLKQSVTLAQSRANLATVQSQLGKQYPKPDADLAVNVQSLKEIVIGGIGRSFWMLFGSVSLLLLIACTNIAALLLARSSRRQHEISIRFALGGSRTAIMRQLLTETFLLALGGAAVGLIVAAAASKIFQTLAATLPRVQEIHLNATVVLYSLACSLIVTFLCGLLPAIRAARKSIAVSLAQASFTQVSTRNRLQWLLVGVQVALAITLLAGAGLLIRGFQELGRVSPGFQPDHLLTFHISASYGETVNLKAMTQRIDRTIDSLAALPGVSSTAVSAKLPGVPSEWPQEFKIAEGQIDPNRKIVADSRAVSLSYFATVQIPLLEGRSCRELPNGADVLVNRSFANTYFGQSNPIGHHLSVTGDQYSPLGEIRGIVGDAREEGLNHAPGPTVYWCISGAMPDPYYLVRTLGKPITMARTIRERIRSIEPTRSVFDIAPLTDHIDEAFSENRISAVLLGFFAATALSLACLGLYGTLSYSVAIRQREIGLRMALGALPGRIATRFLLQGLRICFIGCAVGVTLAVALGRVLSGMLFGVSPTDVVTLSGVIFIMLIAAAISALVPSLRASHVDPMVALRYE
ncbi:MAG TPA: ABC transporter permease [Candidatus Acidoferrales bacterium]|nr:ABC transporter permease [Candidatus Acidoferrales bacterium]